MYIDPLVLQQNGREKMEGNQYNLLEDSLASSSGRLLHHDLHNKMNNIYFYYNRRKQKGPFDLSPEPTAFLPIIWSIR